MAYTILISQKAEKSLAKQPAEILSKLRGKILSFARTPKPRLAKKLPGDGENGIRLNTIGYKILYEINEEDKIVSIYRVTKRRKAYDRLG